MEIRIIIAGSRGFDDYDKLKKSVDEVIKHTKVKFGNAEIQIVSGTARGADLLGERYAKDHDFDVARMPADWNLYGKRAGYIRNKEMARYAVKGFNHGVLIAFWDGMSRGTKSMIDLANEHGLDVHVIRY